MTTPLQLCDVPTAPNGPLPGAGCQRLDVILAEVSGASLPNAKPPALGCPQGSRALSHVCAVRAAPASRGTNVCLSEPGPEAKGHRPPRMARGSDTGTGGLESWRLWVEARVRPCGLSGE